MRVHRRTDRRGGRRRGRSDPPGAATAPAASRQRIALDARRTCRVRRRRGVLPAPGRMDHDRASTMSKRVAPLACRPFQKVLIANRGEIAVRVIQACQELGLTAVAVYSEADRAALHVTLADEAYEIGPAPPTQSYLDVSRILEVAQKSGARAVHPGYGFLAENPSFARSCRDAGLIFVGPTPEAMEAVGAKIAARALAERLGVPVVPGETAALERVEQAAAVAERIGYPIAIKASAGGGGRGVEG